MVEPSLDPDSDRLLRSECRLDPDSDRLPKSETRLDPDSDQLPVVEPSLDLDSDQLPKINSYLDFDGVQLPKADSYLDHDHVPMSESCLVPDTDRLPKADCFLAPDSDQLPKADSYLDRDQFPKVQSYLNSESDQFPMFESCLDPDNDLLPMYESTLDLDSDQLPMAESCLGSESDQLPVAESYLDPDDDRLPTAEFRFGFDSDHLRKPDSYLDRDTDQFSRAESSLDLESDQFPRAESFSSDVTRQPLPECFMIPRTGHLTSLKPVFAHDINHLPLSECLLEPNLPLSESYLAHNSDHITLGESPVDTNYINLSDSFLSHDFDQSQLSYKSGNLGKDHLLLPDSCMFHRTDQLPLCESYISVCTDHLPFSTSSVTPNNDQLPQAESTLAPNISHLSLPVFSEAPNTDWLPLSKSNYVVPSTEQLPLTESSVAANTDYLPLSETVLTPINDQLPCCESSHVTPSVDQFPYSELTSVAPCADWLTSSESSSLAHSTVELLQSKSLLACDADTSDSSYIPLFDCLSTGSEISQCNTKVPNKSPEEFHLNWDWTLNLEQTDSPDMSLDCESDVCLNFSSDNSRKQMNEAEDCFSIFCLDTPPDSNNMSHETDQHTLSDDLLSLSDVFSHLQANDFIHPQNDSKQLCCTVDKLSKSVMDNIFGTDQLPLIDEETDFSQLHKADLLTDHSLVITSNGKPNFHSEFKQLSNTISNTDFETNPPPENRLQCHSPFTLRGANSQLDHNLLSSETDQSSFYCLDLLFEPDRIHQEIESLSTSPTNSPSYNRNTTTQIVELPSCDLKEKWILLKSNSFSDSSFELPPNSNAPALSSQPNSTFGSPTLPSSTATEDIALTDPPLENVQLSCGLRQPDDSQVSTPISFREGDPLLGFSLDNDSPCSGDELTRLRAVFEALDRDKDGFVKMEDFVQFATVYGAEQVKYLTGYLDPAGLGVINFRDFYRGISEIQNEDLDMQLYDMGYPSEEEPACSVDFDDLAAFEVTEVTDSAYVGSESAYSECETFTDEDTGGLTAHEDPETEGDGSRGRAPATPEGLELSLCDISVITVTGQEEQFEDFGEGAEPDLFNSHCEEEDDGFNQTTESSRRLTPSGAPISDRQLLAPPPCPALGGLYCSQCHKHVNRLEDLSTRLRYLEMDSPDKRTSSKKEARRLHHSGFPGDDSAEQQLTDMACDETDLTDKVLYLEQRVSEMEREATTTGEQQNRLRQENLQLLHRAHALEEQLKDQELRSDEVYSEETRKHRDELRKMESDRSYKLSILKARVQELENENLELRTQLPVGKATLQRLEEERDRLQDQLQELQHQLYENREQNKKLGGILNKEKFKQLSEKEKCQEVIEELRRELEQMQLMRLEMEHRMGLGNSAALQEYNCRTREAELEQEVRRLKQEQRTLKEQNEELNGQIINLSIQGAKNLFSTTFSDSLAAEISSVSRDELMEAIHKQEEINLRLQDYIDRIIVAIMETNPAILEVKIH